MEHPAYIFVGSIGMSVCLHRYFSHRAFETSRPMTLLLAIIGSLAYQKGCLWWAGTHRKHHMYCDQPGDPHSQIQDGFWFAFIGWTFVYHETEFKYVPKQFITPELLFLNRFHWLPKTIQSPSVTKSSTNLPRPSPRRALSCSVHWLDSRKS